VVRVIGLENMVVHLGVGAEGVGEIEKWPVHQIPVQGPLKKRRHHGTGGQTDGGPVNKIQNTKHGY
jgi:hypothetical protein